MVKGSRSGFKLIELSIVLVLFIGLSIVATVAYSEVVPGETTSVAQVAGNGSANGGCKSVPVDSSYKLVFDDEFNGTKLDRSRWSTGWFGSGITGPIQPQETACYDPAQVTVAEGSLNLTAIAKQETCRGAERPYSTGIVTTNGLAQFTYGYFEARIYVPAASTGVIANWPAFWADGQNWPTDGEMDILEGLLGKACAHFHSPSGSPGMCAAGNYTGWHIFAGRWIPGSVTYYYDNVAIGTITEGITSMPMYLILTNAVSPVNDYGGPNLIPADMQVDWVHVYSNASEAVAVKPEAGYTGPSGCAR